MDFLFEIIGETILEGILELSMNKKISKWIRYPALIIIVLIYTLLIGVLLIIGIKSFSKNFVGGIIIILIDILILILTIIAFKKKINDYKN